MRTRTAVVLVLVVMLTGACSSKKSSSSSSGTTTTVSPANPTTTAAPATVPASTASTVAGVKLTTPQAASAHLFDAWKAGDKAKARQAANDASVNELFSHPYTGPSPTFQGCEPDSGEFTCSYTYEGGAMLFTVEGSAAAGYTVTDVSYIAD